MSTFAATGVEARLPGDEGLPAWRRGVAAMWVTLLTGYALAVHGYHPYSEDGGLYVAGIQHLLDPALYPRSMAFVEAHLRFSVFAPAVAALVRGTHLGLGPVLLALHVACIWATLLAVWMLAARCFAGRAACMGAAALMAAWLTVPVAGTSLILMDPYLTARSVSLPCALLALAGMLDLAQASTVAARVRAGLLCCLPLVVAGAVHPLMAGYAVGEVALLGVLLARRRGPRVWGTAVLCAAAAGGAAGLHLVASRENGAYLEAAMSRYYWFLSRWEWYELLGLVGPMVILGWFAWPRGLAGTARRALARMAVVSGMTAVTVALLFAHEGAASHLVARLQPLRTFQVVYALMALMLGGWLGERVLRRAAWRWVGLFAALGGVMFFVQRSTYPGSAHLEWPGGVPANRWEQAFAWVSRNTPKDALFALDADYTSKAGEDAQGFRAVAQRSALPDYSKDGGEASITPALSEAWRAGVKAQRGLSAASDAARTASLRPFGVSWMVLLEGSPTAFDCPYRNEAVKVCRLP